MEISRAGLITKVICSCILDICGPYAASSMVGNIVFMTLYYRTAQQRTSLRREGQLRQSEGRLMQRAIHAALKRDRAARTAQVGGLIVAKLAEGKVHEAFRHLKGWYREASETQARPCFQTMELLDWLALAVEEIIGAFRFSCENLNNSRSFRFASEKFANRSS